MTEVTNIASALTPNTSAVPRRHGSGNETQASHGIANAQATIPSPAVSEWASSSGREYGGAALLMGRTLRGRAPDGYRLAVWNSGFGSWTSPARTRFR